MYNRRLITALIASITLLLAVLISFDDNTVKTPEITLQADIKTVVKITVTPTPTNTPTPTPTPSILDRIDVNEIVITGYTLELTSLGTHYITAYDPWECGYNGSNYPRGWVTASDEICFRADYHNRYLEPTTCAIDRNLYSFGDLFYIEEFDRVFIAQDTGSAVKGKHLDLFYEDHSDVISFPTGYYTVYAVNIVEYDVKVKDYNGIELIYD